MERGSSNCGKWGAVLDKNENPVTVYQEWSQADLENFSAIVSSAIGLSTRRGDNIVIKNMEFVQEDLAVLIRC